MTVTGRFLNYNALQSLMWIDELVLINFWEDWFVNYNEEPGRLDIFIILLTDWMRAVLGRVDEFFDNPLWAFLETF